jgi:hypothetical protein
MKNYHHHNHVVARSVLCDEAISVVIGASTFPVRLPRRRGKKHPLLLAMTNEGKSRGHQSLVDNRGGALAVIARRAKARRGNLTRNRTGQITAEIAASHRTLLAHRPGVLAGMTNEGRSRGHPSFVDNRSGALPHLPPWRCPPGQVWRAVPGTHPTKNDASLAFVNVDSTITTSPSPGLSPSERNTAPVNPCALAFANQTESVIARSVLCDAAISPVIVSDGLLLRLPRRAIALLAITGICRGRDRQYRTDNRSGALAHLPWRAVPGTHPTHLASRHLELASTVSPSPNLYRLSRHASRRSRSLRERNLVLLNAAPIAPARLPLTAHRPTPSLVDPLTRRPLTFLLLSILCSLLSFFLLSILYSLPWLTHD